MVKTNFKTGDMVKVIYRANWIGEIIDDKEAPIYSIRQMYTADGRPQRIKRVVKFSEYYLRKSETGGKNNG